MPEACRRFKRKAPEHRKGYSRHKTAHTDVNITDVFVSKMRRASRDRRPIGFCVDIGSPRCVFGIKELNRIFHSFGRRIPDLRQSHRLFRFGDMSCVSLGTCTIPVCTPPGIPSIQVEIDVVSAEFPALLGMNVLDSESLTPCTISNRLVHRQEIKRDGEESTFVEKWSIPLVRAKSNHLFAPIEFSIRSNFTRS